MEYSDLTFTEIRKIGHNNICLASKEEGKIKYTTFVIDISKLKNKLYKKFVNNQIYILRNIHHPNVIKFIDKLITKKQILILTEYYNGGTLLNFLNDYLKNYHRPPPEEIVQYIMRQIIDGLKYLHDKKIVHRDLKCEHIMINYEDEYDKENNNIMKSKIVITDFFSSAYLKKGQLSGEIIGTPVYMDPGILNKRCKIPGYENYKYDEKVDIWSLGIIFCELLTGYNPFSSISFEELLKKVNNGDYYLPTNLSKETVSFLYCMLQYYPSKRTSIDILFKHEFLRKDIKKFKKLNLNILKFYRYNYKIKMNTRFYKLNKIFDENSDSDSEEKDKLNSKKNINKKEN